MSFGAVAVAAGIIALEPAFATGAAIGVALVAIGLGISVFAFVLIDAEPVEKGGKKLTTHYPTR